MKKDTAPLTKADFERTLNKALAEQAEIISGTAQTILEAVDFGFTKANKRFSKIDKELASIKNRLNNVENRLGSLERRITAIEDIITEHGKELKL